MSFFGVGTVDTTYLETPIVVGLVVPRISLQILVNLCKQGLSRDHNDSLGSADLVVLIRYVLLPRARDILKGVENWDEIGECLTCSVVGVDNHTEVLQVVL